MSTDKQIAFITGATGTLGFALSKTLARDHGFHVILGTRNPSALSESVAKLQSEGLSVEGIHIDLTDDTSITKAAQQVQDKHSFIDVLVNNAGISLDIRSDRNWTGPGKLRQLYTETFNTNVFGTAAVTEAFVPLLQKSKSTPPRIVFLTSKLGSVTDRLDTSSIYDPVDVIAYRASKSTINMLCAHYARKFLKEGWKVNTVCPGYVVSGINEGGGVRRQCRIL